MKMLVFAKAIEYEQWRSQLDEWGGQYSYIRVLRY